MVGHPQSPIDLRYGLWEYRLFAGLLARNCATARQASSAPDGQYFEAESRVGHVWPWLVFGVMSLAPLTGRAELGLAGCTALECLESGLLR